MSIDLLKIASSSAEKLAFDPSVLTTAVKAIGASKMSTMPLDPYMDTMLKGVGYSLKSKFTPNTTAVHGFTRKLRELRSKSFDYRAGRKVGDILTKDTTFSPGDIASGVGAIVR